VTTIFPTEISLQNKGPIRNLIRVIRDIRGCAFSGDERKANSEERLYFTSANNLTGAPEPFSNFRGATTMVAPDGGTTPKPATFSR